MDPLDLPGRNRARKRRCRRWTWLAGVLALLAVTATMASGAALQDERKVLFHETFDGDASLDGWEPSDGAVTGQGARNQARIDQRALLLEGTAVTQRWVVLLHTVALGDATRIRLSGRIRTDRVDPGAARFKNCNLLLRFPDGAVRGTRILEGTHDWTTLAIRAAVPPGTREVTVGCFLSMPGRAWFDDVLLEAVGEPAWQQREEGHYVYHTLPGDTLPRHAVGYNEESYRQVTGFLGVDGPPRIHYFKYPDLTTKEELSGMAGNAHAVVERNEIHSIWPTDRHEIVHILTRAWGAPPALLGEGIAVHLSGQWQGEPVARYAARVVKEGRWIPLTQLVDTRDFRRHPDLLTYAESGAFVEWIVERRGGKKKLEALYGRMDSGKPKEFNLAAIEEILGVPLPKADQQLQRRLRR